MKKIRYLPFGYTIRNGHTVIEQQEADIVRNIFRSYIQGASLKEIAEDLTYYFAASEQIPTSVALGVLMNKDNTVRQAGGFIIQMMPYAEEETISKLEKKIAEFKSVTYALEHEHTPEKMMEDLLGDMDMKIYEKVPTQFHCNCSKERVEKAVISVGKKEIQNMIDDGEPIEVNCHFCNTHYHYSVDDLKRMLNEATR